jgi:hypothetical protein
MNRDELLTISQTTLQRCMAWSRIRSLVLAAGVATLIGASSPTHAFSIRAVTAVADPARYEGPCPGQITFTGWITTDGPGTLQYTWTRSDGAVAPVVTLEFETAGTKRVTTTWTLGGPGLPSYSGWEALRIVWPTPMESNQAHFTVSCGSGGPASSAVRYTYRDAEGPGECILMRTGEGIAIESPGGGLTGEAVTVQIVQRGIVFRGAGVLAGPDASGTSRLQFWIVSPRGIYYDFTGILTGDGHGRGTYSVRGLPFRRYPWRIDP